MTAPGALAIAPAVAERCCWSSLAVVRRSTRRSLPSRPPRETRRRPCPRCSLPGRGVVGFVVDVDVCGGHDEDTSVRRLATALLLALIEVVFAVLLVVARERIAQEGRLSIEQV